MTESERASEVVTSSGGRRGPITRAERAASLGISSNRLRRIVQRLVEATHFERRQCEALVVEYYREAVILCQLRGIEPTYRNLVAELAGLITEDE